MQYKVSSSSRSPLFAVEGFLVAPVLQTLLIKSKLTPKNNKNVTILYTPSLQPLGSSIEIMKTTLYNVHARKQVVCGINSLLMILLKKLYNF